MPSQVETPKRILFVDDEPRVLAGLRRLLRGLRHQWQMEFVAGGQEALSALAAAPADVLVTDVRMPGMDGSQLLEKVIDRHPATVRIVLSGQCDRQALLKIVGLAHQFLTKPCASDTLKSTLARACRVRDYLADERYQRLVSPIRSVPSLFSTYAKLVAELNAPAPSIRRVGAIISRDVGMTARLLQLVSSGFFGAPQEILDPARAATALGTDIISHLCRTGLLSDWSDSMPATRIHDEGQSAFSLPRSAFNVEDGRADEVDGGPTGGASQTACLRIRNGRLMDVLTTHSLLVAAAARRIAEAESQNARLTSDAYLAGLLSDVGIFVLSQDSREPYMRVRAGRDDQRGRDWGPGTGDSPSACSSPSPSAPSPQPLARCTPALTLCEAETREFHITHADLGGCLMALWGLPDAIVDAIAFHHSPSVSGQKSFSPLTAVHVASALLDGRLTGVLGLGSSLDRAYLRRIGLAHRVDTWRAICDAVSAGENEEKEEADAERKDDGRMTNDERRITNDE